MTEPKKSEQTTAAEKRAAEAKKADVSLNDLDKDLALANERVDEYLTRHLVKQGYFNPDDKAVDKKDMEQNDPKLADDVKDHSAKLPALEVAREAVKDRDKKK